MISCNMAGHSIKPFFRGKAGAGLLLLVLLLAPSAAQAQSVNEFVTYQGAGLRAAARVKLGGSSSHFPARITVNWGDGSTARTTARDAEDYVKHLHKVYGDCGVYTVTLSVTFDNGASHSGSDELNVGCPSAQPANSGPQTCDVPVSPGWFGCRPVPDYYLDNRRAVQEYIIEVNRREERARQTGQPVVYPELSSFGYRCPDATGNCPTNYIPGPADNRGLTDPDRFASSDALRRPNTGVQRINSDGIGVQSIVDQNPIDAVDIWGPGAEGGGEVCFLGTEGRLIYLDARTSPRAQSELAATTKGDIICGTMPGPGSVVYLPPADQT